MNHITVKACKDCPFERDFRCSHPVASKETQADMRAMSGYQWSTERADECPLDDGPITVRSHMDELVERGAAGEDVLGKAAR